MEKQFLYFIFYLFFFISCSSQQKELPLNSNYIINLDGKKEPSIAYSSIFKSVHSIVLETNKDCLIGTISELQVFDGLIYILDQHIAKSLFVFDMEGRFIRKIGSLGRGPGEYIRVTDFTLDTENRFIFLCNDDNRMHKYQLDGTYVHSINIQEERSSITFIQFYNGRLFSSVSAWEPTQDDYLLLEIDPNNGEILSRSLPLKYNKGWAKTSFMGHSFFMSRLNNSPRYTELFMDYVVTVGETITPYIELKSKYLVTDRDLENLPEGRPLLERLISFQENSKIWDVHSFVENDDFVIFTYQSGIWNFITAVYHKGTGMVRLTDYLSNDLIFKHDESGMFGRFVFSDTKGAYEVLHTNMMDDFQESIKNNEVLPGFEKADQFLKLKGNQESNPVIFFYEFK